MGIVTIRLFCRCLLAAIVAVSLLALIKLEAARQQLQEQTPPVPTWGQLQEQAAALRAKLETMESFLEDGR